MFEDLYGWDESTKMKAEFHPSASEEIVDIGANYEDEVPGLGNGFIVEVERIVGILRDQSKIGQEIEKDFQRILLARFPYSLIYCIEMAYRQLSSRKIPALS